MFVRLWVSRAGWLLRYNGPILQCFRWCIRPWGVCASRRRASPSAWQLVWWKGGRELCFKLARSIFFWLYTQFTRIIIAPLGCYHLTNNVRACCFFFPSRSVFVAESISAQCHAAGQHVRTERPHQPQSSPAHNESRPWRIVRQRRLRWPDGRRDAGSGDCGRSGSLGIISQVNNYIPPPAAVWTFHLHDRIYQNTHKWILRHQKQPQKREREELYYSSEKEEGVM